MQANNQTFTVATYNIFDGRSRQRIVDNILELIENGASVICLQEVWPMYRNVSMSKLINAHLPAHFESKYFLGEPDSYNYGLGMVWNKNTLSAVDFKQLPLPLKNGLTLWDKMFFWAVRLAPRIFKRGALIGTFTFGEKKIRITNLHLDFQGGDSHRTHQLQFLTNFLASQDMTDSEIICGDFNTVGLLQKSKKLTMLERLLGEGFKSAQSKPYTSAIVQQLDYIFVKNLHTHQAKILKLRGSDHYPLLAEVSS